MTEQQIIFAALSAITERLRRELHWSTGYTASESSMSPNTYHAIKGAPNKIR